MAEQDFNLYDSSTLRRKPRKTRSRKKQLNIVIVKNSLRNTMILLLEPHLCRVWSFKLEGWFWKFESSCCEQSGFSAFESPLITQSSTRFTHQAKAAKQKKRKRRLTEDLLESLGPIHFLTLSPSPDL